MKVGIIGIGRMGKVLAEKLQPYFQVVLFDRNPASAKQVADSIRVSSATSLTELTEVDAVILAVPDNQIPVCIEEFSRIGSTACLISIATNVSPFQLVEACGETIRCIGVKIIGQADEMAAGERPYIIIHDGAPELIRLSEQIFSYVGDVVVGDAEIVSVVNGIAAQQVLMAAVQIEDALNRQGYGPSVIRAALRQVAAGILKAYSDNNLGPFGCAVVERVRNNLADARKNT